MRTASEIAQEIDSLRDYLSRLERARLEAIRAEVRAGALTDEVVRELHILERTYESRYDGGYGEDESEIARKEGLDPAAHLGWLLEHANRCAEIVRFLCSCDFVRAP
jgi:hypothetical protein